MSLYFLVYGKPCYLPVELKHHAFWAIKCLNLDFQTAGDNGRLQLSELEELRNDAYDLSKKYKDKMKWIRWQPSLGMIFSVAKESFYMIPNCIFSWKGQISLDWPVRNPICHSLYVVTEIHLEGGE